MRSVTLALFAALTGALGAACAQEGGPSLPPGRRHAIVIGIDEYEQTSLNLTAAARDARHFAAFLQDASHSGGYEVQLLTGRGATRVAIGQALEKMRADTGPNDTLIFFFSGHGFREPGGQGYLVPTDGRPDVIEDSCYPLRRVLAKLRDMAGKQKLLILDCCHSGALGEDLVAGAKALPGTKTLDSDLIGQESQGAGLVVLSSSQGDQVSFEDVAGGADSLGFFTKYLVQGLRGEADGRWGPEGAGNGDGLVSIHEIYEYVYYRANAAVKAKLGRPQQAKLFGDIAGSIYLAKVAGERVATPLGPPPAPTPEEPATEDPVREELTRWKTDIGDPFEEASAYFAADDARKTGQFFSGDFDFGKQIEYYDKDLIPRLKALQSKVKAFEATTDVAQQLNGYALQVVEAFLAEAQKGREAMLANDSGAWLQHVARLTKNNLSDVTVQFKNLATEHLLRK